jgi:hypothetical protein
MESEPPEGPALVMSERIHAGAFAAGGITFTVETNRPGFADLVGETFRDLRVGAGGPSAVVFEVLHHETPPSHPWAVWRDGEPPKTTVTDGYVLAHLLGEINRLMFERTGERVHLHGAALVRNGHALVLAGPSRAGKSTLAAWLTHRGWGFLTDEAALVDPDALTVAPFWRPIGVRRPGPLDSILRDEQRQGSAGHDLLIPASTIGVLSPAAPLAGIAFPCRARDGPAALTRLSPAATLVELTQHFPGLIAGGRAGFRRLARLVEVVPGYVLRFHDLDDAERALRTLVDTAS